MFCPFDWNSYSDAVKKLTLMTPPQEVLVTGVLWSLGCCVRCDVAIVRMCYSYESIRDI